MDEDAEVVGGIVAQDPRGLGERLLPRNLAPVIALPEHRHDRTVFGLQALVRIAIAVRQPALVDRFVVARHRRSEEHTSELQSLMRISYAVFCLKTKKPNNISNKFQKLITLQ